MTNQHTYTNCTIAVIGDEEAYLVTCPDIQLDAMLEGANLHDNEVYDIPKTPGHYTCDFRVLSWTEFNGESTDYEGRIEIVNAVLFYPPKHLSMAETLPRDCGRVIKQMMEKIPATETAFLTDLQWNFEDAAYKAPEETIQWERTSETLYKHIGALPTQDWHYDILSIYMMKPLAELKEIFKNP